MLAGRQPSPVRFKRVFATDAGIVCRRRWSHGTNKFGICHLFDLVDSPAREQLVSGDATCHRGVGSAVGFVFQ